VCQFILSFDFVVASRNTLELRKSHQTTELLLKLKGQIMWSLGVMQKGNAKIPFGYHM
jgi:hypothetical protein